MMAIFVVSESDMPFHPRLVVDHTNNKEPKFLQCDSQILVHILNMFSSCSVCKKATKNVCNLCKLKYYCSFRCQKLDYKNHKIECKKKELFNYDEKTIPNQVFQTWSTKRLPPSMMETRKRLMKKNPSTKFLLFDDIECEEFIKENFSSDVLKAFQYLVHFFSCIGVPSFLQAHHFLVSPTRHPLGQERSLS